MNANCQMISVLHYVGLNVLQEMSQTLVLHYKILKLK